MIGGHGNDTAVFNVDSSTTATIIFFKNSDENTITTAEGTDALSSIEKLQFTNQTTTIAALSNEIETPIFINDGALVMTTKYSGNVEYIQYEYYGDNESGDNVAGSDSNDFINVLGGDDAVNAGAADDIIDGGTGSNFLTGGAGDDTFYIDARSAEQTWTTITDFTIESITTYSYPTGRHSTTTRYLGDVVNIFGWQAGVSSITNISTNAGAVGYEGLTYDIDIDGNGIHDTSITFSGLTLEQVRDPLELSVTDTNGSQLGYLLFG